MRYKKEVKIPNAVYDELTTNAYFSEKAEKVKSAKFISILDVNNKSDVDLLQKTAGLDLGESEALVLCRELKSDLLLMDEAHDRFVAKQLGLNITDVR